MNSGIQLFDEAVRRDQRIVGLTAGAALAKTRTREDAIRLARRVDASRETIRVRFVSLAAGSTPPLRPLVPLPAAEAPAPGEWKQVVKARDAGKESADVLVTYVGAPVVDEAAWRDRASAALGIARRAHLARRLERPGIEPRDVGRGGGYGRR